MLFIVVVSHTARMHYAVRENNILIAKSETNMCRRRRRPIDYIIIMYIR